MSSLEEFKNDIELNGVVKTMKHCQFNYPHCRPGQAVCNKYNVPKELEDDIWEDKSFTSVHDKILAWSLE